MTEIIITSNTSKRSIYGFYSAKELLEISEEDLVEKMTMCDCQPIGETYEIDCNCCDEWEDYTLIIGNENNYSNIDYSKARRV